MAAKNPAVMTDAIILVGKDKGKKGKVTKVLTTGKVVVEGINLVKKHQSRFRL